MLQISAQLTNEFTTYIGQQGIPSQQHRYYLKWMRYYLDFCHKYQFKHVSDVSLSAFLKMLKEKKQPVQLQNRQNGLFSCILRVPNPLKDTRV